MERGDGGSDGAGTVGIVRVAHGCGRVVAGDDAGRGGDGALGMVDAARGCRRTVEGDDGDSVGGAVRATGGCCSAELARDDRETGTVAAAGAVGASASVPWCAPDDGDDGAGVGVGLAGDVSPARGSCSVAPDGDDVPVSGREAGDAA
jgi:hypothetical protein